MSRGKINNDDQSPETIISRNDAVDASNYFSKPSIKNSLVITACIVGVATSQISMNDMNMDPMALSYNESFYGGYPYMKLPSVDFSPNLVKSGSNEKRVEYDLNTYTPDAVSQQIVLGLRKELDMMKNRLKSSIPIHTIIYMVGSSIVGTIAAVFLFFRFVLKVYVVDPYYLICTLIIAITLFATAAVSLKDWKRFLNER